MAEKKIQGQTPREHKGSLTKAVARPSGEKFQSPPYFFPPLLLPTLSFLRFASLILHIHPLSHSKIFLSFLFSTSSLLCCLWKSRFFPSPKSFVMGVRAIPNVNRHQRRLLTSLSPAVGFLLSSPSRVASFISSRRTYLSLTSSFQLHIKVTPTPLATTLIVRNIHCYTSAYHKAREITSFMDCNRVTTFIRSTNTNNTSRGKGKISVRMPLTVVRKKRASWCMG